MDPRQRRASDGLLSTVKESSRSTAPPRGHRSPLLSYKTEPGTANIEGYHNKSLIKQKINISLSLWLYPRFLRSFFNSHK